MGKKIVDIYCRVSTDDQNVEQQVFYLKKWCRSQGYRIRKVVADLESGRLNLVDRKKFLRLLKSKSNREAIVIFRLDRLTRNWNDVTLIEKHFRDCWNSCKLISAGDPVDLSNAAGRFNFRVMMALNCYMPEDMIEKQKIGIDRAKKEGKYKGGSKGRSWTLDS